MKSLAVFLSDVHLTLYPPACRAEEDWLQVQRLYLKQVTDLAQGAPVFIAGDLFDRWNPPPELICFALRYLPEPCYAVPGQHDLLNHRKDQMHRSGYGVLVEAGKIHDLSGGQFYCDPENRYRVRGFGWNEPPEPVEDPLPPVVLLSHQYVWTEGHAFPGAPPERKVSSGVVPPGYRWAVFGDNHKGFYLHSQFILNCGTFIRRKSDEVAYRPQVGVLYSKGMMRTVPLDVGKDVFRPVVELPAEVPLDMESFIEGLQGLGEHGLNFREAVENYVRQHLELPKPVTDLLLQSLQCHD